MARTRADVLDGTKDRPCICTVMMASVDQVSRVDLRLPKDSEAVKKLFAFWNIGVERDRTDHGIAEPRFLIRYERRLINCRMAPILVSCFEFYHVRFGPLT